MVQFKAPGTIITVPSLKLVARKFLGSPVTTRATDVITDSRCSRSMDMLLGSSLGLDISMAMVSGQTTQISMIPAAARLSDINIVSGNCLDPWHQHGLSWYQESQIPTQTVVATRP